MNKHKTHPAAKMPEEYYLTRLQLARRWNVSTMTVKRRERDGSLHSYVLGGRIVRFRLSDIETAEAQAEIVR